ncbi:hypothetical protein [Pontibacter pamirensis]|uniref:hypothetical protein n=1 Tax=Pontibacter pamirensis TaxID=2562824 RepID=UPI00138A0A5B|nr:hypothetical protein [Pontibacter pamirensis]
MLSEIKAIGAIFNIFSKLKDGFTQLKKSNLLLNETSIHSIVENYFGFQQLPNSNIKLHGKLSWYSTNTNFLVYSPFNTKGTTEQDVSTTIKGINKRFTGSQLTFTSHRLSVPSLKLNEIKLTDDSSARIIWLYPQSSGGLILETISNPKEDMSAPLTVFKVDENHRPIPCLVDPHTNIDNVTNKTVEVIGKIITAPLSVVNTLMETLDPFMINMYSNFYRPFSANEGMLAIDLRTPDSKIKIIEEKAQSFNIAYTVQAKIEFQDSSGDLRDEINNIAINSIPDRQGMGDNVSSIGVKEHPVNSIVTIGDISWQGNPILSAYAMTTELETHDARLYQEKMTKMAYSWQVWQKKTRNDIKRKTGQDIKINPIMCSNTNNAHLFHPNGMLLSRELEERILSKNPETRKSIDWLKISTGR